MNREDVTELHYIVSIAHLESIMQRGILSKVRAKRYVQVSVANPEIQQRRAERDIPGGLQLDKYANLFFNARNAMLFEVTHPPVAVPAEELAVLRVHHSVLDRSGVVVTDINAAAGIRPRWHPVLKGLAVLDKGELFAEYWTGSDPSLAG